MRKLGIALSILVGLPLVLVPQAASADFSFANQPLAANDGWAASGTGTTGGSGGTVTTVRTRDELAAAVAGTAPKIVIIEGTIEGPSCAGLADPEYTLEAYLAAYDPAVWGRATDPSGPLEAARVRSVANQRALTEIKIGPNTTVFGKPGATLKKLTLMIDRSPNVIVRNLRLEDAADCFPRWRPTDGAEGNWNSDYDLVSVRRSTNVWIDHNTFTDGDNPDSAQPVYFGRPWQVHDGALDITHTSNFVTVSWNVFTNHDKTMLIGSSDTVGPDVGLLNVTVHSNLFDANIQRLPRVRFGKVDVFNNYYRVRDTLDYAIGLGIQSAIYAENNYFRVSDDVALDRLLKDWRGTTMTEIGTRVDGRKVSLIDEYNAVKDPDFGADAGWTPTLRAYAPLPTPVVPLLTTFLAGAWRLPA